MEKNKLKKKIINYIFKQGKKQRIEKILKTSIKSIQKFQKKSHYDLIKLTMLNSIPAFRVIKLKKEKSNIEIPTFISSLQYRTNWGIKYLIKTFTSKTNNTLNQKLKKTFLTNTTAKNEIIKFKDELQKNALKQKSYFKYYRW
jgi:ribosomal protein S7